MITPTRLLQYVRGSGAFGYAPWYYSESMDGQNLVIEVHDPQGEREDTTMIRTITPDQIRNTFINLVTSDHPCFKGKMNMDDPDIDAERGDVILQYALFGELIYG